MADVFVGNQTITTLPAGIVGVSTNKSATSVNFNSLFIETLTTITQSYCITTGTGAFSAGPLKIADGVTIKVPDGSSWRIV